MNTSERRLLPFNRQNLQSELLVVLYLMIPQYINHFAVDTDPILTVMYMQHANRNVSF